jgi:outer membrane protein OmpA-like peptidoglycan-associated protein
MRLGTGLVALGLAVVVLGWFGRAEYATHMQTVLTASAEAAVEGSVHDVAVTIEGRDITVSGLADGVAEHDALIAALDAVRGRRVVNDALEVLPSVEPYRLTAIWDGSALQIEEGHAPTRTAQETLAALGAGTLPLAAGAPDRAWGGAAARGVQALSMLEQGQMALVGTRLSMAGVARTPEDGAALRAVLDQLPEGYRADMGVSYLDDGSPAAYQLHYTPAAGAWVEGKLPPGVTPPMLAEALGLGAIDNGATQGLTGDAGRVPEALAALAVWLTDLEALDIDVGPEGVQVDAGIGMGGDAELVSSALAEALGPDVALTVNRVEPAAQNGETRVNAATGGTEMLRGRYWLPMIDFAPGPETCPAEADAVLTEHRIGFVSGSARLDARAQRAVNALAAVLRPCFRETGLDVEIGGHTDSTGDVESNRTLSLERARAVREALIMRGLPVVRLTAAGYGAEQPIADNDTDAGRAANRRTALRWIE